MTARSPSGGAAISASKRSAGGQLEQPCEVNSSTSTGRPGVALEGGVAASLRAQASKATSGNEAIAALMTPVYGRARRAVHGEPSQARGLTQRSPENRPKSASLEHRSARYSIASAAS